MSSLPNYIVPIQLDCIGSKTKKRWIGQFMVKCVITHADLLAAERMSQALLPSSIKDAPENLKIKAESISQLSVRVVDGPEWWYASKGGQLLVDDEPIYQLMILCQEASNNWEAEVEKRAIQDESKAIEPDNSKP